MADDDQKNWMSCLGWGCLGVLVVSILGIGGCVAYVYKGGSAANSVAAAYLESVDAGRYEEAFETLGSAYTQDRGLAEFVAFEQGARAQMGSCGDWRMSGTNFNRNLGRSIAQLTYLGMCDGGLIEVTFSLEKAEGRWIIQDIRYNEPASPVIPTCAQCGTAVPPAAKFCPNCGSAIDGDEVSLDESIESEGPEE